MRYQTDQIAKRKYDSTYETDKAIVERVEKVAKNHGVSMAQIAFTWLLHKEQVAAPIVGVTKISHLEDSVNALSVSLSEEEIAYLEEPHVPHKIVAPLNHPNDSQNLLLNRSKFCATLPFFNQSIQLILHFLTLFPFQRILLLYFL